MSALYLFVIALLLPQAPPAVTGVVTDALSGAPVTGARILLARTDGPLTSSVVAEADDRGRFTFREIPPGTYRVFVDEPRYLRQELQSPIAVAPGRTLPSMSVALVRRGVITGHIRTEQGNPAAGVYVRAWAAAGMVAEARTNDLGEYRLFGLAPGSYVVSAERYSPPRIEGAFYIGPTPPCPDCMGEGAFRQALASLLAAGNYIDPRAIQGRSEPPVFFPAAADRAGATSIEVAAGAVVPGIDLRLVRR